MTVPGVNTFHFTAPKVPLSVGSQGRRGLSWRVWLSGGRAAALTSFLSPSAEGAGSTVPLQRSQSLPHSAAAAPGGAPDPSTLGSSAFSEREASRLDKFKQLLAGPNTDLGKCPG